IFARQCNEEQPCAAAKSSLSNSPGTVPPTAREWRRTSSRRGRDIRPSDWPRAPSPNEPAVHAGNGIAAGAGEKFPRPDGRVARAGGQHGGLSLVAAGAGVAVDEL